MIPNAVRVGRVPWGRHPARSHLHYTREHACITMIRRGLVPVTDTARHVTYHMPVTCLCHVGRVVTETCLKCDIFHKPVDKPEPAIIVALLVQAQWPLSGLLISSIVLICLLSPLVHLE